jgi:Ricin-type beta-trefoil lectin domain
MINHARGLVIATAVVAATATSMLISAPVMANRAVTHRASRSRDIFEVVNLHSGKCLDVYNGPRGIGTRDLRQGALVDQWTCYPGHTNQEWQYRPEAHGELVNRNSGKCLEVYNGPRGIGTRDLRQGALVDQWTCYPGHTNQEWDYRPQAAGGELVNRNSGKCLEVYNGSTGIGTRDLAQGAFVDQWTCYPGHTNQLWSR